MRNPNRIDTFCTQLAEVWHKVPDWRFGQLMINVLSEYMNQNHMDAFYTEDTEFFAWLQELFSETKD